MKQSGISKDGKRALKALRIAVKKAIARQWAAGLPIYVVENGKILRKWQPEAGIRSGLRP